MVRYSTPIAYFVIHAISVTGSIENKSIVSRLLNNFEMSGYYKEQAEIDMDAIFDTISDSIEQCLDAQMMNTVDPVGSFLKELDNYCNESQESIFESALADYNRCSGENLSDFIETFLPAAIGTTMTCASYFFETLTLNIYYANNENGLSELIFQKRMPDECVASLLGDNAVGNFYREHTIHPGKDRECLAELGRVVPDCTLHRWPIPLPGLLFKTYTCVENKMEDVTNQMCTQEIKALSNCLPTADEIKTAADESMNANDKKTLCDKWAKACTIDSMTYYDIPSITMLLPRPLSAAPLSDTCMSIRRAHDASSRLDAYQDACIPEEDREIWSDGTGIPDLSTSRLSSSSFGSSDPVNSESSNSNSFWKFSLGLICGIVAAVGAAVFWDRRRKDNKDDVTLNPPNSSLT